MEVIFSSFRRLTMLYFRAREIKTRLDALARMYASNKDTQAEEEDEEDEG